ncbi:MULTISPECIES: hypothetical protein [unclassified Bradyrhizobium]|uniref:hypothetical protein n=1 Tax=unclassified Bradyrhizobium TaxID=2631580 RepID=UPI002916DC3A|nr:MULTISPECIES: hypothetical protein [unclassified Bradyrhizobium]
MTKYLSIAAALLGLAAAIVAAAYWWRASRVAIRNSAASISDVPELYIQSTQVAFNESSRLNAHAAIWTGLAALLSATAAVFGVL